MDFSLAPFVVHVENWRGVFNRDSLADSSRVEFGRRCA
jgi:hypothetical protein